MFRKKSDKRSSRRGRRVIVSVRGAKRIIRYTGSPDSEVVADLIDRFDYRPDMKHEILAKYNGKQSVASRIQDSIR